jgi:glutamate 5-kinase
VKVGSSSLTTAAGGLDADRVDALVDALAKHGDREIVLVSSGAIAAGLAPLGLGKRPRDLARQQAAASVGQGLLMARYTASYARYARRVGQVLLTTDDMSRRTHYRNAQRTLEHGIRFGRLRLGHHAHEVRGSERRDPLSDHRSSMDVQRLSHRLSGRSSVRCICRDHVPLAAIGFDKVRHDGA